MTALRQVVLFEEISPSKVMGDTELTSLITV